MNLVPTRRKPEPTIALINIVFLMLIFFLVVGTLSPPLDPRLKLVDTQNLDVRAPISALVLRNDGSLSYLGREISNVAPYFESLPSDNPTARIVPDRAVSALRLVEVSNSLTRLGAERVLIVTERVSP